MFQTLQISSNSYCGAPVASALAHMDGTLSTAAFAAPLTQVEGLLPLHGELASESHVTHLVQLNGLVQQVLQ